MSLSWLYFSTDRSISKSKPHCFNYVDVFGYPEAHLLFLQKVLLKFLLWKFPNMKEKIVQWIPIHNIRFKSFQVFAIFALSTPFSSFFLCWSMLKQIPHILSFYAYVFQSILLIIEKVIFIHNRKCYNIYWN